MNLLRRNISELWLILILLFLIAFIASSCSMMQYPDIADSIGDVPPTGQQLSDYAIWSWSGKVNRSMGGNSGYLDLWGTGSAIAVSGLSIGTVAAVGHPAVKGLALGTTGVVGLAQIFKNTEKANILDDGSSMIGDAQAAYLTGRADAGGTTIPTTCVTPQGAKLYADTLLSIKYVRSMSKGLRPPTPEQGNSAVMNMAVFDGGDKAPKMECGS
jgi:hypothetical protein